MASALRHNNLAHIGQRELGKLLGISAATAGRRVRELVDAGYIDRTEQKLGQRAHYVLNSPIFAQKQGKQDIIVSSPSGGRRFASLDYEKHGLKSA
jgi:DNA-binding Lrp family transcriptional regulator